MRSIPIGLLLFASWAAAADDVKSVQADVRRLIVKLAGDKADERGTAAHDLGKLGSAAQRAVPALQRLLGDKDSYVRTQAAIALLKIDQTRGKEALAALTALYADKDELAVFAVLVEMREVRPTSKDVVAGLLELARNKHPMAALAAWIALDNLDAEAAEAAPVLVAALKDPLPAIRSRAALGLARIDRKYVSQAVPILRQTLAEKDLDLCFQAASALIELKAGEQDRVFDALSALLKEDKASLRLRAAQQILSLLPEKTATALPVVIGVVRGKDRKLRLEAIEVLAALGPSAMPAEEALRNLFKDDDVEAALAATQAVIRMQPEKAREVFPTLVSNHDRNGMQGNADLLKLIEKLYEISLAEGDREQLKMLTEQLRRPQKKQSVDLVQLDAAIRLAALGRKAQPATGDLVKALDQGSILVRGQALLALARIGPEAKPAVPRLTELYKDRDQPADLRQAAARAIKAVDRDAAKELGIR
jgi:HEAT repeat protein